MRIRYILLFLTLSFISACTPKSSAPPSKLPLAVQGTMDLRQQSLEESTSLSGTWHFYWNQLLEPGDRSKVEAKSVNFPVLWTDQGADGIKYPSFGYATYRLQVLLPPHTEALQINLPDTYSAYRFYINDKLYASNGVVSKDAKGFKPYWESKMVSVPDNTDTLRLTLQIANFSHHKGGANKPLILGTEADLKAAAHISESIDLLLTGCLLMGGVFFLGLYIVGNRDKAILYYALFSIVYSYRIIGVENYVLHSIFQNINWYITIRFEYISLFMGIGLFNLYTSHLFPLDVNKNVVRLSNLVCFGFALLSVFLPPYYFTQFLNPFIILAIICIIYTPIVYINAYRLKRPASLLSLIGSVAILISFFVTLLYYWNYIPKFQFISFACYISFFFLQTLILSNRVYFKLKLAGLEAQQGLLVKSEFLSTMSHEIRTPLNAVIGMSHLLLQSNPRDDQREHLDVMLFSANNLLAIVNDILDYNKIEEGKILFEQIEMDFVSIAKNIVAGLKNAAIDKGISLKLKVDGGIRNRVIGDPTRITQVISNLVHNAIKFTQTGGVDLVISIVEQHETQLTLKIEVIDTGIGISKENQHLIFERFTQADSSTSRSYGGAGLGLAISKRILELQDSSLSLESEEGCGANFFFVITFKKGSEIIKIHPVQASTDQSARLLANVSILLVDDNKLNVLVAKKFLEKWGANIDVAYDGLEAVNKLDVLKHDLILMDLHMPVLDGYEATRKMRSAGVKMPIIALTANVPDHLIGLLHETGLDDYVVKPFLPDELYSKVLHHLSKS